MTRDFKPGDVALLTFNDGSTAVGVHREADTWAHSGGFGNGSAYDLIGGFTARPLVVIDPESREQVERLAKAMHESDHIAPWHDLHNETRSQIEDAMQAALRQFANPTPPPLPLAEPTGLGAVVEDVDGRLWVLNNPRGSASWSEASAAADLGLHEYRVWREIAAVRILSEGVQP